MQGSSITVIQQLTVPLTLDHAAVYAATVTASALHRSWYLLMRLRRLVLLTHFISRMTINFQVSLGNYASLSLSLGYWLIFKSIICIIRMSQYIYRDRAHVNKLTRLYIPWPSTDPLFLKNLCFRSLSMKHCSSMIPEWGYKMHGLSFSSWHCKIKYK